MKFPNKVTVCGFTYTIKYNPKKDGGSGTTRKQTIHVGTNSGSEQTWETFCHEIMELTACHQGLHFTCGKAIRVVLTHDEFQNYASAVAASLWPLVRNRLNPKKHGK